MATVQTGYELPPSTVQAPQTTVQPPATAGTGTSVGWPGQSGGAASGGGFGGGGGFNGSGVLSFLQGMGGPSTATLRNAFPQMLQQGLLPAGSYLEDKSTADEIFIPGYGWFDTMVGADSGNPSSWQWSPTGFGGSGMGGYWTDPMLQFYTDFGMSAIDKLMAPQEMNPVLGGAIGMLQSLFNRGDPGYDALQGIASRRLQQLRQPLFSMGGTTGTGTGASSSADFTPEQAAAAGLSWVPKDNMLYGTQGYVGAPDAGGGPSTGRTADSPDAMMNSALLRSKFVEPLTQARDAMQQQALERASARGLGLTSGMTEELARGVDQQYGQQLTQGYRDLMLAELQANESREQEAVGIGNLLAQMSNRTLPISLSAAGSLAGIGQQLQQQPIQNLMNAMGIATGLGQMPLQNMMATGQMMNSFGAQPVPQYQDPTGGFLPILLQAAGMGENIFGQEMGNNANFMQSLFGGLGSMFGGMDFSRGTQGSPRGPMPPMFGVSSDPYGPLSGQPNVGQFGPPPLPPETFDWMNNTQWWQQGGW